MPTYQTMHGDQQNKAPSRSYDTIPPHVMDREEPPEDGFVYLVPANIFGYDIQEKKWSKICSCTSFSKGD